MEFFKFQYPISSGYLNTGQMLNGIRTAMWIERYREAGEFKFTAPVSTRLRTILPLGSIISHVDTLEAMVVENHEIDEDVEGNEPEIVVTGRSLESWLDQRCVGDNIIWHGGTNLTLPDYILAYDVTWAQATKLINEHIYQGPGGVSLINPGDQVLGFRAVSNQEHIGTSSPAERMIKRGSLYKAVLDLIAIDDFGIRVVRPNQDVVEGGAIVDVTDFRIHNGVDRRNYIVFSHIVGDLQKAKYLWSIKNFKSQAYVVSTYNEMRVNWLSGSSEEEPTTAQGYHRRILYVDAEDIDSQFNPYPEDTDRIAVLQYMNARGRDEILSHRTTDIISTDISSTTRYQYRRDYNVGDLVTVNGNYNVSSPMRVIEHVEFQDENGESGYPTLALWDFS